MIRNIIFLLFVAVSATVAFSLDTATQIFDRNFHTLKVAAADDFMALPIIRIGTNDRVIISFDEIAEDNSYLEYRLLHCNADWQPSRLVESEYLDGFNSAKIEDFAYSVATFVHYVNYRIELPNEDMQILHSGNYLLQVYNPEYPDDLILQARFMVAETLVYASGEILSRTDKGHYGMYQQLEIAADVEGLGRINPYQDIEMQVMQNIDQSSLRSIKTPLRVDGSRLVYAHQSELIYPAGNEYRRFESISNNFAGMNVDSLRYMGSNYHVWLKPDYPRASRQYSYDRTQHGRFLVREYNATDSDIAADYITVHFRLDTPKIEGAEIYVDGEFSHGAFAEFNKMTFDSNLQAYTAQIPLKQGAYNYRYVLKEKNGTHADSAPVEGNKYETGNEYNIMFWFHPPGARADRLVGTLQLL